MSGMEKNKISFQIAPSVITVLFLLIFSLYASLLTPKILLSAILFFARQSYDFKKSDSKNPVNSRSSRVYEVNLNKLPSGIEPPTSALPRRRSTD